MDDAVLMGEVGRTSQRFEQGGGIARGQWSLGEPTLEAAARDELQQTEGCRPRRRPRESARCWMPQQGRRAHLGLEAFRSSGSARAPAAAA